MTADQLAQRAYEALTASRFDEARARALEALAVAPDHVRAKSILANALDQMGRTGEAVEIVSELVRAAPHQLDYLYWLSTLLRKAGRAAEALPLAERVVRARPESAEVQASLAAVYAALGRAHDALNRLRESVTLNPAVPANRYNLALLLLQVGDQNEAEAVLSELVQAFPDFVPARVTLGETLLMRGLADAAVVHARSAITTAPNYPSAHYLLARALSERTTTRASDQDDEEAERHIRTALELDPGSYLGHGMLGFRLQERGEFKSAGEEFEFSLRLNPAQGAAYYGLASCAKQTGVSEEQIGRMKGVLADGGLSPSDQAYVHYAIAKLYEDAKEFEPAISHLDAANGLTYELNKVKRPFDAGYLEERVSWVIETFTPEFFERQKGAGNGSELPLLVLGMMRSGTTLVEQILSSHPGITGGGELMFWMEHAGKTFLPDRENLDRTRIAKIADAYLAVLREFDGAALRVTDKMPQNTLFAGLIHAIFPNARIVHCRRHPVDTCLSIYATPYTASPDFAHHRGNIVFAYRQYLRLMAHWREVLPADRFVEVEYEKLVENREAVTRRLIEFVGLEWSDECLRHEANRRAVKTPSRWQVRQPIYRTSVARWKNFEPWLGEFAELLEHD